MNLLRSVFRNWKIILAGTVGAGALTFFLTMRIAGVYQSSATLYINESMIQDGSLDNLVNIITGRETLKETGLRLLAMHLCMKQADPMMISPAHFGAVQKIIPPDIRGLISDTDSITYLNMNEIADTHLTLIRVMNHPGVPYYSNAALSAVTVSRKSSDMISLTYFSNDPGVCQKTLEILIDVSIRKFDKLNQNRRQQQEEQYSSSTIQIIDKPNFPLTAGSMREALVLLGMLAGFVIPLLIFLLRAYFNKNIQTPQRAEKATGLEIAGIIPDSGKLYELRNADTISDGLSDTILKNLYMTDHKSNQIRILMISTRAEEGKTMISGILSERLRSKGRKCLVVTPYIDSGSWSVVSYRVDNSFFRSRAEDIIPVEKMSDADILIIELPPLLTNDYPVELVKQFDMAFLVCRANREWVKADQTALDGFIRISGMKPQIILNHVELDVVEEILGKISEI